MAIEKGGFLAVYDQNMRLTSKKSMRSLNIENSFGVFQQAARDAARGREQRRAERANFRVPE
jgi:hypothetical protein